MATQDGEIKGVRVKKLIVNGHDRGNLVELLREDEGLCPKFGQLNVSRTFPGVIKAFHWHKRQHDLWYMMRGDAQVVLYDCREESATHKTTSVYYMGESFEPMVLAIPPGVAHGFRVLSNNPLDMLYVVTECYDPNSPDEFRIAFDDPKIGFDWTTKNR